jgi:Dolichyl-phosphate-mannose-protein mannosyltransferase
MTTDKSTIRNPRSKILWLVIPTLIFIAAIWLDLTPYLRGPDEWPAEWRWSLRPIEISARTFVPLLALAVYVIICVAWLSKLRDESHTYRSPRLLLGFLTVATPAIQLALATGIARLPLNAFLAPTLSPLSSGYMSTALDIGDMNSFLANYPAIMPTLANHVQTHPPGPILMHWLGLKFFESNPALADSIAMPLRTLQCHNPGLMALDNPQIASALIGMLIPLIGALAVWPMYAVGKRIVGSNAALIAAALFPIMPLFAMWPTQWDQIYPLLLFSGLYFMHTGLESKSMRRIFLAGIPLSIATFFSVGNSVLIAIVALYGLIQYLSISSSLRLSISRSLLLAVSFVLGCASIWISYALIYHVNPIEVLSTGSRLAFESTTGNRSYLLWLLWNPIDFAIFLGIPIVVLLILNWQKILRPPRRLLPLVVSTFVVFLLLDLSGIVRGEVGRLWMYFGPLMLLTVAAATEVESDRQLSSTKWSGPLVGSNKMNALLFGLVALQLFTLNSRWLISDNYLGEPPERTPNFSSAQPPLELKASFDRQIELQGFAVTAHPASIDLTLYWQALTQPIHAYTVFVHVLDRDGKLIGQKDNMPLNDQSTTSCWQSGEYVIDPRTILIDSQAQRPFTIEVGLYVFETGERLPLDDGSGTSVKLSVP